MLKFSKINRDQFAKIVKVAVYLALSSVIAGVISMIADEPNLFGPLTPVVNILLVTLKQALTAAE